jgi:hypothetical protein
MSKTTFSNKCAVLGELWSNYKYTDNEIWQEYFAWADLGCPLAYYAWQGFATLSDEGESYVDEAWAIFCKMIDIDPEGKYDSLRQAFDSSPNEPLD